MHKRQKYVAMRYIFVVLYNKRHNGSESCAIWSVKIPVLFPNDPEQLEITRKQLLKYCGLDTYAMIKILKTEKVCR